MADIKVIEGDTLFCVSQTDGEIYLKCRGDVFLVTNEIVKSVNLSKKALNILKEIQRSDG